MTNTASKLVKIGRIMGAHGVRGMAKVASYTEDPETIASFDELLDAKGQRRFTVELKSWNKDHFIATISGVETREQAEGLKGTDLYVPREALPELEDDDGYYYADLIGLKVQLPDGSELGQVLNMHDFGAGDIMEVRYSESGKTDMLPFNEISVPEVNLQAGYLVYNKPEEIMGAAANEGKTAAE
jgi:16S rRNA processing protein RimM